MCSSPTKLCKVRFSIPCYLLNMLLLLFIPLSLLLFIDSCEAQRAVSARTQSIAPCPTFTFSQKYVRDPLNCKHFYICFGRRFWRLSCPGDTVFSSEYKVCVWKQSRKDDCDAVKEKTMLSPTGPPMFSTYASGNNLKKTKPKRIVSTLMMTTATTTTAITTHKSVTVTQTEMTTSGTKRKTNSLTTVSRETETKSPANTTTISKVTTKTVSTRETGRSSLWNTRGSPFSTKEQLKLKTKLFPPYWTRDNHVTKWWQRKTEKGWKKDNWFTKITTKTTKHTRRVPAYPKNVMDYCGEILTSSYIIGGQPSLPGRWPWQASLQVISAGQPWHRCGGVLVHPLWIITASHCVEGPFYGNLKNWRVVMAEGDLDSNDGTEVYRKLSRIVSHPDYKRASNFPNDIAMLQLDEPVEINGRNVRLACLPPLETTKLFGHDNCWISGWGDTRGSGKQNGLNELGVDIVPRKDCKSMWGRVDVEVLDQQVCVGYGDTGACYGDSGGPLMCEVNGSYYLGGVMSWLINNCSAKGFPNVFSRVQSYLDWIHYNINYYHWWRYS